MTSILIITSGPEWMTNGVVMLVKMPAQTAHIQTAINTT